MKKWTIAILVFLAAMLAVVPAAAGGRGPVGDKISLHPESYPSGCGTEITHGAEEAFYIQHGWVQEPPSYLDFRLYIDGAAIRGGLRFPSIDKSTRPFTHGVLVLYNFPNGMPAGTYAFTGEWLSRNRGDLYVFTCTMYLTFD